MEDDESANRTEPRQPPVDTFPGSNAGGGGPGLTQGKPPDKALSTPLPLTDAEVVQLQIRVIALENLVIALLANAPQATRGQARELADYISPRPGFTQHRSTLHAANQMAHLIERAHHLSEVTPKIV
ncbi:hypothetical protein [Rhizobacter fulvus]|jgi:hypothetical protein